LLSGCAYNDDMEYKDYYKTLGVDRKASADDIKSAYRRLAMKYHPDHNAGDKKAEDKFKDINEAYQVLGDEQQRARYDQLGESYSSWQRSGMPAGGFNWEEWFTQAPRGGRTTTRVDVGDFSDFFASSSFSDFFNQIFGGGAVPGYQGRTQTRRSVPRSARPAAQMEHPVQISLREAYTGAQRMVQVDNKRMEVKIPPGAHTGTKVRMANAGPGNTDLFLKIEVLPDTQFERRDDNLHTEVSIDLLTAVLGGKVRVNTFGGDVWLTIPAGTQPGQTFRLAGQGMPHLRHPDEKGDLYVCVKVKLPRNLTDRQKALFEQLRDS